MSDSQDRFSSTSGRGYELMEPPGQGSYLATAMADVARGEAPRARLMEMIESEVIPRLVLARRATQTIVTPTANAMQKLGHQQIESFAQLVMGQDVAIAFAHLERMRGSGTSVEQIYLDLLAPAARRLGELWNEDFCDFTEVTVGMCRLQQVMHELAPALRNETVQPDNGRCVLLMPVPGDQHTFGLLMVAEFFRRAGWNVWPGPPGSVDDLSRLVRREWFSVVGFSLASTSRIEALSTTIRAIRRASCNRAIGVLVGGPLLVEHPELVALVGADATATDGRHAVLQAQDLLTLLHNRH